MSNVIPFQFESKTIRVVTDENGDTWFVASDVCAVLGISHHRDALSRLDDDERGSVRVDTLGGVQELGALNESGLYTLILRSDKPEAKTFRKWVTNEVIPSIRKTGGYSLRNKYSPNTVTTQKMLLIADAAAEMLRMSDTSKIRMLSKIAEEDGVPSTFLPAYVDESEVKSLTALLKDHGSTLTAVKANTILIDLGLLEERERDGSEKEGDKRVTKRFKSLTTAGLAYGRNETSPQNPRETQPLYFIDKFPRLLDRIHSVSH